MAENEPEMTLVAAITASSQSSVSYDIIKGNDDGAFLINPSSGVLLASDGFDYERTPFYNLSVRASNVIGATAVATVMVHVIDVNDNAPVFTNVSYTGSISEEALPGSVVLNDRSSPLVIGATDADSGMNALLGYRIVDPQAAELFEIDTNTGAIKIRRRLDREEASVYSFQVMFERV